DHLNNARSLFVKLKDKGMVAHVDETWTRSLLGEGRYEEANKTIARAIRIFEEGDESSALAEALTTQGTVLARLGKCDDALSVFDRALTVAENAGDRHSKGLSTLTLIEELSSSVPGKTLRQYYQQAEASLAGVQNPGIRARLGDCARRILKAESESQNQPNVESDLPAFHVHGRKQHVEFSCALEDEVLRYEGDLIKRALESSGGSVTRAARLLGITHQGLAFILNGRQKSLLGARKPVKPRRRSIIRYH
ncbi:MAG TPA: tetratricopeptide repeat protein, partial [Pyrinomonadaceae bacterium]